MPSAFDLTQLTDNTGGSILSPTLSGDGSRTAFLSNLDLDPGVGNADGNVELYLVDNATGGFSQVTNTSGLGFLAGQTLSMSDDGNLIAFHSAQDLAGGNADRNGEIFLYDVAAGGFTQLTNSTGGGIFSANQNPSISADGSRVAFTSRLNITGSNGDGNSEVFLFDASAGFTQLSNSTGGFSASALFPSISGDGNRVVFFSNRDLSGGNPDGSFEYFLAESGGGPVTQLTNVVGPGGSFSPPRIDDSGSRVTFSTSNDLIGANGDLSQEAFLYEGGTISQLTNTASGDAAFASSISGDGSMVAISSDADLTGTGTNTDDNEEVFLLDLGTNTFTQFTNTASGSSSLADLNRNGSAFTFFSTADLTGAGGSSSGNLFLAVSASEEPSPQERIEGLVEEVNALVAAGDLNKGQGNALTKKLENALKHLENGKVSQAVCQLEALRNQVADFVEEGILSPTTGQALLDEVNGIIDQLTT